MSNKILIIKPGDTFSDLKKLRGGFDQWIADKIQLPSNDYHVCHWPEKEGLPALDYSGLIITGSHSMVTEDSFRAELSSWLLEFHKSGRPMLGICYGHQIIAHAFAGEVDYHPKGIELGCVTIKRSPASMNDPLFEGVEQKLRSYASHSQSVITLPPSAQLLAGNEFEPHHSFRIGSNCWGVQFHPEFDHQIMKEYILRQKEKIEQASFNMDQLLDIDTIVDRGEIVLKNFMKIVRSY